MPTVKYIVRSTNPDDTVLRPIVVCIDERGRETGEKVEGWALNDWERAQRFADELNQIAAE